jgi:hypothetical protein
MDGRIQKPIIEYLKKEYGINYVDAITEAGPCKILAENKEKIIIKSIIERVEISLYRHNSKLIVISGHHDCAKNPVGEDIQKKQIIASIGFIQERYPDIKIIGLWIDDKWQVHDINSG